MLLVNTQVKLKKYWLKIKVSAKNFLYKTFLERFLNLRLKCRLEKAQIQCLNEICFYQALLEWRKIGEQKPYEDISVICEA